MLAQFENEERPPQRVMMSAGIGRLHVEQSFWPAVIDHMIRVPEKASLAAMHVSPKRIFRQAGNSTGTNFFGLRRIAAKMMQEKCESSFVALICDSGARYALTYYNPVWLIENGLNIAPYIKRLERSLDTGKLKALACDSRSACAAQITIPLRKGSSGWNTSSATDMT
ncbi:hypothetical protein FF124_18620 [Martelella lutilitoris]|uniref:Uncharacterized protein n=1 Tax=Martelella lutilitoris TaxID=2583532 RepID=A0A5C4JLX3_9HYPH|nr:hypothetical protein [Martelella lutilitoris]TNB46172.1 hypothetical protein FF124_18620 [Martelella lutilitoris]